MKKLKIISLTTAYILAFFLEAAIWGHTFFHSESMYGGIWFSTQDIKENATALIIMFIVAHILGSTKYMLIAYFSFIAFLIGVYINCEMYQFEKVIYYFSLFQF